MKKIHLKNNVWVELVHYELSEEEKAILDNRDESNKEVRKSLTDDIRSKREIPLSEDLESLAEGVYDSHKPVLKDGDVYQLIDVFFLLDPDNNIASSGLINCRLNGEHKQIRF